MTTDTRNAPRISKWLELAEQTDSDPCGMEAHTGDGERECQGLVVLGYLRVADGGYRITDKGREYLLPKPMATATALDQAYDRLTADGYTVHDRSPGPGYYLASIAPESEGASTEPGSAWDAECEAILDAVRGLLGGLAVSAEWVDDDIALTADDE